MAPQIANTRQVRAVVLSPAPKARLHHTATTSAQGINTWPTDSSRSFDTAPSAVHLRDVSAVPSESTICSAVTIVRLQPATPSIVEIPATPTRFRIKAWDVNELLNKPSSLPARSVRRPNATFVHTIPRKPVPFAQGHSSDGPPQLPRMSFQSIHEYSVIVERSDFIKPPVTPWRPKDSDTGSEVRSNFVKPPLTPWRPRGLDAESEERFSLLSQHTITAVQGASAIPQSPLAPSGAMYGDHECTDCLKAGLKKIGKKMIKFWVPWSQMPRLPQCPGPPFHKCQNTHPEHPENPEYLQMLKRKTEKMMEKALSSTEREATTALQQRSPKPRAKRPSPIIIYHSALFEDGAVLRPCSAPALTPGPTQGFGAGQAILKRDFEFIDASRPKPTLSTRQQQDFVPETEGSLQAGDIAQERRGRQVSALNRRKTASRPGTAPEGSSSRSFSSSWFSRKVSSRSSSETKAASSSSSHSQTCGGHGSKCEGSHNVEVTCAGESEEFHSHFSDDSDSDGD